MTDKKIIASAIVFAILQYVLTGVFIGGGIYLLLRLLGVI